MVRIQPSILIWTYSSFGRVLARGLHEGFDFDSLLVKTWLVEG